MVLGSKFQATGENLTTNDVYAGDHIATSAIDDVVFDAIFNDVS